MFHPDPTPENVAKMMAAIPTCSGRELVENFAEFIHAAAQCDTVSNPWREAEADAWYRLADAAERELKRRLS